MLLVSPIIGFDTVLVGMPVINGAGNGNFADGSVGEKGLATAAALVQSSIPYRNSSVRRSHLPWVSVTENC